MSNAVYRRSKRLFSKLIGAFFKAVKIVVLSVLGPAE
jgi:hypothetical protein